MSIPARRHHERPEKQGLRVARWLGRNWARLSYGRKIEPTWLEINSHNLGIVGLASEFAGFRIAQLSDLHFDRHLPEEYIDHAVTQALGLKADAVVLTGDFVHKGFRFVENVAERLAGLSAPCGVFAVLGNHDHSVRNALGIRRHRHLASAISAALQQRGIQVLDNSAIEIRRGNSSLHIVGVDDLWSRRCDLDKALANLKPTDPCVVLAHNPRTVEHLAGRRCDVMLSGHTHGGQVNWPGLGRVTLAKKARKYAAGLYRHEQTHLYVNKGVGCGVRFRFGVRPEVALFELQPLTL